MKEYQINGFHSVLDCCQIIIFFLNFERNKIYLINDREKIDELMNELEIALH